MTAKEKAKDLFYKYLIFFPEFRNDKEYDYNIESGKTCAFIAVEEIINSVDNEHVSDIYNEFWEEVKREIEKL
jgi:hypothetical protein